MDHVSQKDSILRRLLTVATLALFLAIIPIWPYGYYMLLRLIVCGVAAYAAYKAKEIEVLKSHRVPLILVAILFNPLIPVHFIRTVWLPIDVGVGIYLIIVTRRLKR